jgi:hypothetical protein
MNIKNQAIKVFVTNAEDKGKFGEIRFNSSRNDKKTDKWIPSYYSFWAVRGDAYATFSQLQNLIENAETFEGSDRKKGVQVTLHSFSIQQEKYPDKNTGEMVYSKQPRFTIWDWSFSGVSPKQNDETVVTEDDGDSIPF